VERVAFLVESTGERIGCLLNPESLVMRRTAGLARRPPSGGAINGVDRSDDPIMFTGGGQTELFLDLLFDTSLEASRSVSADVRLMTRPLWDLAENSPDVTRRTVRFVWGKTWNVPGVIAAVAERLESFTEEGVPQRSWLRLRMLRVQPDDRAAVAAPAKMADLDRLLAVDARRTAAAPELAIEVTGGAGARGTSAVTRLDDLAGRYLGHPSFWRIIAVYNRVVDPLHIEVGRMLHIPPATQRHP
jgi:hypothetical protein